MEESNNNKSSSKSSVLLRLSSDVPLKERRLRMLQTGKLSDCAFIVGEELDDLDKVSCANSNDASSNKLFHCHKMILATASEVFERMFYGSFNDQPNPIKVVDIRPAIFELFLTYIYSYEIDPVHVNVHNFDEIMYIGDKYMMTDFIDKCVDILRQKKFDRSDVLPFFDLACLYENLSVILLSYEQIKKTWCGPWRRQFLNDSTFYNLNIDNMKRLLVFLKQLPKNDFNEDAALEALATYGKKKNLHDSKNSGEFMKLVDAALILTPSSLDSSAYTYLFGA